MEPGSERIAFDAAPTVPKEPPRSTLLRLDLEHEVYLKKLLIQEAFRSEMTRFATKPCLEAVEKETVFLGFFFHKVFLSCPIFSEQTADLRARIEQLFVLYPKFVSASKRATKQDNIGMYSGIISVFDMLIRTPQEDRFISKDENQADSAVPITSASHQGPDAPSPTNFFPLYAPANSLYKQSDFQSVLLLSVRRELSVSLHAMLQQTAATGSARVVFSTILSCQSPQELPHPYKELFDSVHQGFAPIICDALRSPKDLQHAKTLYMLTPHRAIRALLSVANPLKITKGLLKLFLARPMGAKSLAQHMLESATDLKRTMKLISEARKRVADKKVCSKVENWVNRQYNAERHGRFPELSCILPPSSEDMLLVNGEGMPENEFTRYGSKQGTENATRTNNTPETTSIQSTTSTQYTAPTQPSSANPTALTSSSYTPNVSALQAAQQWMSIILLDKEVEPLLDVHTIVSAYITPVLDLINETSDITVRSLTSPNSQQARKQPTELSPKIHAMFLLISAHLRRKEKQNFVELLADEEVLSTVRELTPIAYQPLLQLYSYTNMPQLIQSTFKLWKDCIAIAQKGFQMNLDPHVLVQAYKRELKKYEGVLFDFAKSMIAAEMAQQAETAKRESETGSRETGTTEKETGTRDTGNRDTGNKAVLESLLVWLCRDVKFAASPIVFDPHPLLSQLTLLEQQEVLEEVSQYIAYRRKRWQQKRGITETSFLATLKTKLSI